MTKGIYQLSIPGCDKVYIGRSSNIEKRYLQHLNLLKKGKHHNPGMKKVFAGELDYIILLEGNNSAICEQKYQNLVPRDRQFNYYTGVDDGWKKRKKRRSQRVKKV